jgi:YMGG-like Gly-zipper
MKFMTPKPYPRCVALGVSFTALALLAGCVTMPSSPSIAVMPAPGKPFEVFQQDDAACRGYAQQSIGTSANDQAAQNVVGGAVIGTALGALAGAAIGNHRDAGVGAAFGLLAGTSMGASSGNYAGSIAQRRYNIAYSQCMYAKGNQVPGYAAPRAIAPPPPPSPSPSPSPQS